MSHVLIWPATWRARKLERRDSEDEESVIDLEEKEKQGFVNTSFLVLLVFSGETGPTTTPCTVTGADDALVCHTATSPSAMTHHVGPRDQTN